MMPRPPHRALTWSLLLPSLRAGLAVVALFAVAMLLAREFAEPIRALLGANTALGVIVFTVTSVVAVVMPVLTNLPLVPLAVLAWGPGVTAALLLLGWVIGAALSFWLGRHARAAVLRVFPAVLRHADIDRLIHPRHRLVSLVMLRMTFPVDVLSYSLGLFSRNTRLVDDVLATAIGAAPFALLFAWFPTWSATAQAVVFVASVLVFVTYAAWMVRWSVPNPEP